MKKSDNFLSSSHSQGWQTMWQTKNKEWIILEFNVIEKKYKAKRTLSIV